MEMSYFDKCGKIILIKLLDSNHIKLLRLSSTEIVPAKINKMYQEKVRKW